MLYFVVGLLAGAGLVALAWFTQTRKIKFTWYEWLIAAAAIIMGALAVQNFDGSLQEFEVGAAWLLLALFGLPALILAAIDVFLVRRQMRVAPTAK